MKTEETNKTPAECVADRSEKYNVRLTVKTADEWTSLLRQYGKSTTSWLGADGIYGVALDGVDSFGSATAETKTLFMFNDTLIGTSDADGNCIFEGMPQNTAAILGGVSPDLDKIEYIWGKNGTNPTDMATLNDVVEKNLLGGKFWNGDCLVLNDTLYITALHVVGGMETDYANVYAVPLVNGEPDWTNVTEQSAVPQLEFITSDGDRRFFICAIYANTTEAEVPNPDEYIYIYGSGSGGEMYVSRIHKDDFPDFTKLTYWTGTEWSTDGAQCVSLKEKMSPAYSVTYIPVGPYAGKYIAVWMEAAISGNVMYAIGDSLIGPFGPSVLLYNAPESGVAVTDRNGKATSMFVYNPSAYPHLSFGNQLLISYNVNVWSGDNETDTYTPRFLWIDLDPADDCEKEV